MEIAHTLTEGGFCRVIKGLNGIEIPDSGLGLFFGLFLAQSRKQMQA
jgi:hypothetical protein